MADRIEELTRRRAELLEELDRIEQYMNLHKQLFPEDEDAAKASVNETRREGRREARNDPNAIAARAEELIRANGKPIQRGELVRRIEASGMPIHSKDKGKYIGTVLWRLRDKFVNVEDQGYWIKGLVIEAAPREFRLEPTLD
jgi:Asp-tRNA(Asn)/Glu-tRNA(Gln) amidotransferase C subunit